MNDGYALFIKILRNIAEGKTIQFYGKFSLTRVLLMCVLQESEPKPAEKQLHLKQIQQESTDAVKSVVHEYKVA